MIDHRADTAGDPVIAVLAAHVIDQIAAGEVIERPASVVKELVDNALDAGARTIVVETTHGGRGVVRVSDDGCGMSPADAVLAFERHATSKLRQADDLWELSSMGFRGEALPSIASVAKVTLTTRRASDLAATRVVIEGGVRRSVSEVGAAVGTTIEVVDLLYNLPARLKFLKGESTEASHVTDFVAKVAMAHPHIHLRLRHNGRTALELPPDRDGFARAQALLGVRIASRMVPISGEEAGVRVTAYLGAPELAQATARGVQIFVGRRPVRDRGVLHAITMGFGELVPRGRYPVAVVLLDLPAGTVDVNVHPQKLEVRFADAALVTAAVRHVVQTGVAAAPWRSDRSQPWAPIQMTAIASSAPPALPFDGQSATPLAQRYARDLRERRGAQASLGFDAPATSAPQAERPVGAREAAREWVASVRQQTQSSRVAEQVAPCLPVPASDPGPTGELLADGSGPELNRSMSVRAQQGSTSPHSEGPPLGGPRVIGHDRPRVETSEVTGYFSQLRYLGQLDLTYLVCEADGELVLVDQHAAHERVELARLEQRHTECDAAVQKLLFPITMEVTPAQLALVDQVGALLAQVGWQAEAFGKSTLAIKAVPAGIRHADPAQLLCQLLEDWAREGVPSDDERLARVLAEIACHSVVRAGDRLAASEAESLLRALDGVDLTGAAPHGRSLLLRLPLPEIGRRFGR
ncbi:MAG: mismatch repair protein MutL [Deltaproteobacteria bacterium]|nr:mismatch repair protein MutL [Deltaproteobacteria bacterium]